MTIPRLLCAPVLVLLLAVAACDQGAGGPASAPSTPAASPAEPTPAVTATAESTPEAEPAASPEATSAPTSSEPEGTPSANMADWTLTTAGWGPVRIGSPLPPELRGQLKPAWECIGPIIQDGGQDRMEFWTGRPDGSGNITTLHIVNNVVSTRAGIRPGDSLEKLVATYPGAHRFRAPGDKTGDVYVLPDGAIGLFFEIKPGERTVEHISVQTIANFTAFQLQICGGQ